MKSYALYCLILLTFLSCSDDDSEEVSLTPASDLFPINRSEDQPLDVVLEWDHPGLSESGFSFDVYLGKSGSELTLLDSGLESNFDEKMTYRLEALELNTNYYWKITTRRGGFSADSEIFQFTTIGELPGVSYGDKVLTIYPGTFQYPYEDSLIYYIRVNTLGAQNWTDGRLNTDVLVNSSKNYPKDGLVISAKYCDDLYAYGYADWYLPSIVELDSISAKLNLIRGPEDNFWSSTEYSHPGSLAAYAVTYLKPGDLDTLSYNIYNTRENLKCKCVRVR